MNTRLESVVRKTADADPRYPHRVSSISGFPYINHADMVQAVFERRCILRRFSFHYDFQIFDLFANGIHKALHWIFLVLAYAGPVVSIALAILVSPWWWFGLLSFFVGLKLIKWNYNAMILGAACSSELEFCFLFYISQIEFIHPGLNQRFEWQQINQTG